MTPSLSLLTLVFPLSFFFLLFLSSVYFSFLYLFPCSKSHNKTKKNNANLTLGLAPFLFFFDLGVLRLFSAHSLFAFLCLFRKPVLFLTKKRKPVLFVCGPKRLLLVVSLIDI